MAAVLEAAAQAKARLSLAKAVGAEATTDAALAAMKLTGYVSLRDAGELLGVSHEHAKRLAKMSVPEMRAITNAIVADIRVSGRPRLEAIATKAMKSVRMTAEEFAAETPQLAERLGMGKPKAKKTARRGKTTSSHDVGTKN